MTREWISMPMSCGATTPKTTDLPARIRHGPPKENRLVDEKGFQLHAVVGPSRDPMPPDGTLESWMNLSTLARNPCRLPGAACR